MSLGRSFVLAFLLAPSAAPLYAQASGTVTHKAVGMPVTHAVAVWDAAQATLSVYLLAAAPTEEETKGLRGGFWQVLLDKPGPDLQKWPKSQPYALVRITWKDNQDKVGQLDQARIVLQATGISGEMVRVAVIFSEGDTRHGVSVTGSFTEGGPITVATKYKEDDTAWDVQATAKVLPATE